MTMNLAVNCSFGMEQYSPKTQVLAVPRIGGFISSFHNQPEAIVISTIGLNLLKKNHPISCYIKIN
jgi:hypothetical protein